MHYIRTATPADVLDTLKGYRDGLLTRTLRKPAWSMIERLIAREAEMRSV